MPHLRRWHRHEIILILLLPPLIYTYFQIKASFRGMAISDWIAPGISIEASEGAEKPFGLVTPRTSRYLELAGSRGESLGFMLRLRTPECVDLKLSSFSRDGRVERDLEVKVFDMPYYATQEASYRGAFVGRQFDPIVPLTVKPEASFKVCPNSDAQPGDDKWLYGEVKIGSGVRPGQYEASVQMSDKMSLPVSVRVWKMQMPDAPAFHIYTGFVTWFGALGHFGKWSKEEGVIARMYYDQMADHQMLPLTGWLADPPRVRDSSGKWILDLENYPTASDSFMSVFMRRHPDSAMIQLPTPKSNEFERDTVAAFEALENTVKKYRWQGRAFVYLWDEPKEEDYPELIKRAELLRKYAPSVKILVTEHYVPLLEPYVDIFVVPINFVDLEGFPSQRDYAGLRARGKMVWHYLSCMSHDCGGDVDGEVPDFVIDRPSVYVRALGAMSHKYDIQSLLYWRANHAFQYYPKRDAWTDQWEFSGNGEGTLFYPGRPGEKGLNRHQPILSLRIELTGEFLRDLVYYNWMDQVSTKPLWWPSAVDNLVRSPREWSKDYRQYSDLRRRIGDFLDQMVPQVPGAGPGELDPPESFL